MNTNTEVMNLPQEIPSIGKVLFNLLDQVEYGSLTVETPEGDIVKFKGEKVGANSKLKIYDWKTCQLLLVKGDIGLGEAYIKGFWDSDEIEKLILFGVQNEKNLERAILGSVFRLFYYRLKHMMNRNSRKGSIKNIHAHYDLGNDFYNLWLDPSMTYSSAFYNGKKDISLQAAQKMKYQNILDQLNAPKGARILEIGCGWGGFMEHACEQGYEVHGVTISKEQLKFAQNRVERFGEKANAEFLDYRDLQGKYDYIVSIEMFEAIGEEYWDSYFSKIKEVLNPGGKVVIQSITISEDKFKTYKKGSDFIQQYIFPGGMLPTCNLVKARGEKVELKLNKQFDFGRDYAETLKEWHNIFNLKKKELHLMGFDEEFIRTWNFYLKYCEGGFLSDRIGVSQFVFEKE